MNTCDIVVVGLGTAGSATCLELARRGLSVCGLDALRPPHEQGSHHGQSRSIRRAYLEGTAYVPMVLRAWELWRRLERDTGASLLIPTGNLTIGPPDGPAVTGFLASAAAYDIAHEALTAADVRKRWPQLAPPATLAAGLEIQAGIVLPEAAIATLVAEAAKAGASLRFGERAHGWSDHGDRVRVLTSRGAYEAGRLLLAAGARNGRLLGGMGVPLSPKRVPVHWVAAPEGNGFGLGSLPVNFWQLPALTDGGVCAYREFYSLPVVRGAGRVKVAPHNHLADCDPETMNPAVTAAEVEEIRAFLQEYLPVLAPRDIRSNACLYSLTPDGEFALGPLPGHANVFAAALAGHGFKFAPVLGEILADMLEGKPPAFDVAMFDPIRFGRPPHRRP